MTAMTSQRLPLRARLTRLAHLFKALARQHHRALVPLFAAVLPVDGVVIDVGAHAGQFAKLFAAIARRGRVYAVEPGSYARSILRVVVRLKRLGNVTVIDRGLSDHAGQAALSVPVKASGSIGFGLSHLGGGEGRPAFAEAEPLRLRAGRRAAIQEQISVTTLDDFARDQGLTRLDLIKADIEGWEIHLLRGGARTLERFRPTLALELVESHLARAGAGAGASAAEAWARLEPLGYRGFRFDAGGGTQPAPAFLGDGDYLFVPAAKAAAFD